MIRTGLTVGASLLVGFAQAASAAGTTEPSDAQCDSLTPTIFVENNTVVGGPYNGRRFYGFLKGTSGDDIIFGTDKNDIIYAGAGTDTVCTFGGVDTIYAQSASLTAYAGSGNDVLFGGNLNDELSGGSGRDVLYGFGGDDTLLGGLDRDIILGFGGNDTLEGGDGDDSLLAGFGDDTLDGGLGIDWLYGGFGTDSCDGERKSSCEAEIEVVPAPEPEPTLVSVPDVEGLNLEAATNALAGFGIAEKYQFDSAMSEGLIIGQDPAQSELVEPGSEVTLTVSLGPSSVIAGRVTDPDGNVLPNIQVSSLSETDPNDTVETDVEGKYALTLAAQSSYTLNLKAEGYADQVVIMTSPEAGQGAEVVLDVTMIPRADTQTFFVNDGATINAADGAKVTLAPGSFDVEDANRPIQVTVTPLDVSNASTLAAFPGDFSGQSGSGTGPIVPLGTVEFEFTDADGNPLNLRQGVTAEIEIPIFIDSYPISGEKVEVGNTIALWSLNEATGVWLQEGTGEVVESTDSPSGLALRGTVSHFSWWNCDVSINSARVNISISGPSGGNTGTALISATAKNLENWRGTSVQASPITVPGGTAENLSIPSDTDVCYRATVSYSDNGSGSTSARTEEVCETAGANDTIDVVLVAPESTTLTKMLTSPSLPVVGPRVLTIEGSVGLPVQRVSFSPNTAQTSVIYSLDGDNGGLPPGLSLKRISDTSVEIVGVPTTPGTYYDEVKASAANNNIGADVVGVQYIISGPRAPIFYLEDNRFNSYPIPLDVGGSIIEDEIELVEPTQIDSISANPALPEGIIVYQDESDPEEIVIKSTPGTSIPESINGVEPIWYNGVITLTNSGGSAEVILVIYKVDIVVVTPMINSDEFDPVSIAPFFTNGEYTIDNGIFLEEPTQIDSISANPALPEGIVIFQDNVYLDDILIQSTPGTFIPEYVTGEELIWYEGQITITNSAGSAVVGLEIYKAGTDDFEDFEEFLQ